MDNRKKALVLLNMVKGLGPLKIQQILSRLSSPEDILNFEIGDFTGRGIPEKISLPLIRLRDSSEFKKEIDGIVKEGIKITAPGDKEYPVLLSKIYDPPAVLYIKGRLDVLSEKLFAVVGSRRATFYGLNSAEKFAYELAMCGLVIVSGLARGIDTYAHKGALASGRTVVVLGSGLLNIYPRENKTLAREIEKKGCLVSEYPLFTQPYKENFPRRNRIVSGMSLGVLVVEAAKRSGALITANLALEQGREVFALPGKINSAQSQGTNSLIKQGAKLVENVGDILEEFGVFAPSAENTEIVFSQEEEKVINAVSSGQKNIEEIVAESGLPLLELNRVILSLKLKKAIKELPGKVYAKN